MLTRRRDARNFRSSHVAINRHSSSTTISDRPYAALDYSALKKRVAAGEAETAASATFVEFTPSTGASTCVIEIAGPRGVTIRVQVTRSTWPDLVALTQVVCPGAR